MSKLESDTANKNCQNYSLVSVKCVNNTVGGSNITKGKSLCRKIKRKTATRKERRKKVTFQNTKGEKYIKNLSNRKLTDAKISLISRGLKFMPVNKSINRNKIRRQVVRDLENRPKYMFHGKNRDVHPFYVKSDWNPPVQPLEALESYLEEVKSKLAEIEINLKNNLSRKEHEALTELKQNTDINLKKGGRGSTIVVMNKTDKIREGQIQIDDKHDHRPLSEPVVKETHSKVLSLITDLHREKYIDDMTRKWIT